jgi:endonuclease YncB( thermonuclease family)
LGRLGATVLGVAMVAVLGIAIRTGGAALVKAETPSVDIIEPDDASAPEPEAPARPSAPVGPAAQPHAVAARPVAPDLIAPMDLDLSKIEREQPRLPLGEMGLAHPPAPDATDWKGTVLFRPVAGSSGGFEAMGRHIDIAGIEGLKPEETCDDHGYSWPCGMRARTAFRNWLGGRSIECDIPKDAPEGPASVRCKRGKQDAGAWLVVNGWARAAPGGPYGEEEKKARDSRKGIFGRAPETAMPAFNVTPPVLPTAPLQ